MKKNISICGSGLMGSGIALLFSLNGYRTKIYAVEDNEEKIKTKIYETLNYLSEKKVIEKKQIEKTLSNILITDDIYEIANDADVIFECIPEDMQLKKNLFEKLDSITNTDVLLATNTSVMSVTEIASKSINKERILGTHFWNPPYLVPLVEVVKTSETAEIVIDEMINLLKSINKLPIRVNKDVPGFVANRLQHALWREAISIVENGIADPETVDLAVKNSFGLRLSVLGPFENADMVGNDLALSIQDYILKYLENTKKASKLLENKVASGELGFKTQKGFYSWNESQKKKIQEHMLNHLIKATKN